MILKIDGESMGMIWKDPTVEPELIRLALDAPSEPMRQRR
jgi:hypothetical protein